MIPERSSGGPLGARHSIGARELGFGDDVPYRAEAWEQVERGERSRATRWPRRSSTSPASRSETARATSTPGSGRVVLVLDPLDPPLERLRRGSASSRRAGAVPVRRRAHARRRHAVEVDAIGVSGRGGAGEERPHAAARPARACGSSARSPGAPLHKRPRHRSLLELRSDPRRRAALRRSSTFFLMAEHAHELDGRRRESRTSGCARGSSRRCSTAAPRSASTAATRPPTTGRIVRREGAARGARRPRPWPAVPLPPRVDPHRNLAHLEAAGFAYDSSLGFSDALRLPRRDRAPVPPLGLRAGGAARPRRGAARGDGRHALGGALPRPRAPVKRRSVCGRCSTGPRRTAEASPFSGTPSSTTRRSCPAGIGCTGGSSRRCSARGGVCLQAGALAEEARAWLS